MNLIKISFFSLICCLGFSLNASNSETITYEDIVNFSKPTMLQLSPDGSKIAYNIQNSVIEDNITTDTIYFYYVQEKVHIFVAQFSSIIETKWDEQSNNLYVLSKEKNKYQISQCSQDTNKILLSSTNPISVFEVDTGNNSLIYSTTKYDENEELEKRLEEGYVYRWKEDNYLTLQSNTCRKKVCEEIIILNFSTQIAQKLTDISYQKFWNAENCPYTKVNKIRVSPSKQYIAMEVGRYGQVELGEYPFTKEILIWDNFANNWLNLPAGNLLGSKANPCWIDNQKLIFQLESTNDNSCKVYLFDCDLQNTTYLDFAKELPAFREIIKSNSSYQLIGVNYRQINYLNLENLTCKNIQLPENIQSKNWDIVPSVDREGKYLATTYESSNVAPEIVLYNMEIGEAKIISNLNPSLEKKQLGHVEELSFVTPSGIKSNGYLVHPVKEELNTCCPLIIATYGFSGGFILDAEWHSTFPAQVLASQGYMVLLLNPNPDYQNLVGDPNRAMKSTGWDRLELFETAVDDLVAKGLVDPSKVGIYGWSHGGFITNFLITHSSKFKVACYGEGADYNPSQYWLGGDDGWAKILDNVFAGPPWGETLSNYQKFSPFFNVQNIKAPVLMEYADHGNPSYAFEMYVPLKILHKPAELVFYKNEKHNFVLPKARLASMKRKVDWFNYWLLNKKDSDPAFQEQYERWDAMKLESEQQGH